MNGLTVDDYENGLSMTAEDFYTGILDFIENGNLNIVKKTKKGRRYYGCENNPECDFMVWQRPSGKLCPRCGSMLLERGNKLSCADEKCGYIESRKSV